jgi:hypothetical protein
MEVICAPLAKLSSMPMQAYCFHMHKGFANCSKEVKIYPLTTEEIAEAQQADVSLKHLFNCNSVIDRGLEICGAFFK